MARDYRDQCHDSSTYTIIGSQEGNDYHQIQTSKALPLSLWFVISLCVVCAAEAVALLLLTTGAMTFGLDKSTSTEAHLVEFQKDSRFHELYTKESVKKAWAIYNLPHGAFVQPPNIADLGLSPNNNTVIDGLENVFAISAFHQLHCLQSLQSNLVDLAKSRRTPEETLQVIKHASHCVEYLRQGIHCAADNTLEGPNLEGPGGDSLLQVWGVHHNCQSWDDLVDWRDKYAIPQVPPE
nr:uncharacterized protein CTRU02_11123 [Colletotrichum truncatum]KAF6786252.1 hypothetical protein CTRU02_11123 [Colletotrichum truncatum]